MNTDLFESRHIGPRPKEITEMLNLLGRKKIRQLINETIPKNIQLEKPMNLPKGISENSFLNHIKEVGEKNKIFQTYIGLGYNPTITPAVIQRNILENPGWYTAYTPYQAEIAQGRLEALFNFQTVICDLTGMDLANASLLDESTSAAEGMTRLYSFLNSRIKKTGSNKFFVHDQVLPQTLSVLKTRATPLGIELVIGDPEKFEFTDRFYGALIQCPGRYGEIVNLPKITKKLKHNDIKCIVAADIQSLVLLEGPGKYDVDVVVGTSQRFGIPLGYGGPHAAFFATKEIYKRNIPGRIIGQTQDTDGNPALRMALQTREQHIKRDRATSNICTAQVLLAVMAGMYAVYHGPAGLKYISTKIHENTKSLEKKLKSIGLKQLNKFYFDTIKINIDSTKLKKIAEKSEVNFNYIDKNTVSISINETTNQNSLNELFNIFKTYSGSSDVNKQNSSKVSLVRIPESMKRFKKFMTHPVFNSYHSETSMMRYIKRLENKDYYFH